jgi:hypothetical protein
MRYTFSTRGSVIVRKSLVLLSVFLLTQLGQVFAQSNDLEDHFLAQKQADYVTSVYFVLAASGIVPATSTPEQAMSVLAEKHWGLPASAQATPITFGELSLLLMHAFEIPGGIFYTWFPNTRYAAHEIVYRGFAGSDWAPDRVLTPDETLQVLNAVLTWKDGRR